MLTNNQIVEIIGREKLVEKIIQNITDGKCSDPTALADLAQDLYVSFLEDTKLPGIYNEGHISYYVTRCVVNNIVSSSSPFYYRYLRPQNLSVTLDEKIAVNLPDGKN